MEDCHLCQGFHLGNMLVNDEDEPDLPWAGDRVPEKPCKVCDTCVQTFNRPYEPKEDFPNRYFPPASLIPRSPDSDPPYVGDGPHPHHTSLKDLRESALFGCFVCRAIISVLLKAHMSSHTGNWRPEPNHEHGWLTACRRVSLNSNKRLPIHVDFTQNGTWWFAPFELLSITEEESQVFEESAERRFVGIIETTKDWIQECLNNNHPKSKGLHLSGSVSTPSFAKATPQRYPSRLLEIINSEESQSTIVRVVETREQHCTGAYVALSHCWGTERFFTCNETTYSELKQGVSVTILSKTFQDAIKVTKALGMQYIWIDSLCIIQGDADDWARESSTMDRVYSQSCITLAAVGAKSGTGGFYLDEGSCLSSRVVKLDASGHMTRYLLRRPKLEQWREEIERAPLSRRAWTFQERLIPQRIMHFGRDQIFLECKDSVHGETSLDGNDGPLLDRGYTRGKQIDLNAFNKLLPFSSAFPCNRVWMQLVEAYSRRDLTFHEDKLLAISALAKITSERANNLRYAAGMFETYLPRQLLWFTYSYNPPYESYVAPTWSWASSRGAVEYNLSSFHDEEDENDITSLIQVESINVDNYLEDPFGRCTKASIVLVGHLFPIAWSDLGTFEITIPFQDSERQSHPTRFKMQPRFDNHREEGANSKDGGSNGVQFLPVLVNHYGNDNKLYGILVKTTKEESTAQAVFERVGFSDEYDSLLGAFGFTWPQDVDSEWKPKSLEDIAAGFKSLIRGWQISAGPSSGSVSSSGASRIVLR